MTMDGSFASFGLGVPCDAMVCTWNYSISKSSSSNDGMCMDASF